MTKIAVVTGTSKGIGQTITEMLLAAGWEVFGVSRTASKKFIENSEFHQIFADLRKVGVISKICDVLPKKIDLLINNAGSCEISLVKDITPEHFDRIISLNLRAPILLTTSLLSKINSGSTIINISSVMSRYTEPEYAIYTASKAGLDRFTTTLAKERKDLKIVGILPSVTDTHSKDGAGENIECDPGSLSTKDVAKIVLNVVGGEYNSGNLLVVNKKGFSEMWMNRDKYIVVNIVPRRKII